MGQSPRPGAGEEYELALRHVRLNESVSDATTPLSGNVGDVCPQGSHGPLDGGEPTKRLTDQQILTG